MPTFSINRSVTTKSLRAVVILAAMVAACKPAPVLQKQTKVTNSHTQEAKPAKITFAKHGFANTGEGIKFSYPLPVDWKSQAPADLQAIKTGISPIPALPANLESSTDEDGTVVRFAVPLPPINPPYFYAIALTVDTLDVVGAIGTFFFQVVDGQVGHTLFAGSVSAIPSTAPIDELGRVGYLAWSQTKLKVRTSPVSAETSRLATGHVRSYLERPESTIRFETAYEFDVGGERYAYFNWAAVTDSTCQVWTSLYKINEKLEPLKIEQRCDL